MVELFVTDMDGTLLNQASALPTNFKEVLITLQEKKIPLVLASGRTLRSIKHKLGSLAGAVTIISDNGSLVEYKGERIYTDTLEKADLEAILNIARQGLETSIIAASATEAYIELRDETHRDVLQEYYPDYQIVADILAVNDVIVKMTLISLEHTRANFEMLVYPALHDIYEPLRSGVMWIDVMKKGVDKATGLMYLLTILGIDPKNIIAFGDYHNDIGMLQLAGQSYAVAEAHDDVKAVVDAVIGSHHDEAVTHKILEIIS